ncbi:MAG: hypothetical protein AAB821_03215 [Patescibacteria group bacterium]
MFDRPYTQGFSIILAISILALVLVIGATFFNYQKNTDIAYDLDILNGQLQINNNLINTTKKNIPIVASSTASTTEDLVNKVTGRYEEYNPDRFPFEFGIKPIMFFFAGWDEKSRELDINITTNSDQIPLGVVILKTDYDRRVSLKSKYKVIEPNTFVQTDRSGKIINSWSGSITLEEIVKEIK